MIKKKFKNLKITKTEELKEKLYEVLNVVWKERSFTKDWRKGLILPIHKKGDKAQSYHGITLLSRPYTIYAMVRKRKEKGILPNGQPGFRKGRGAKYNIYILTSWEEGNR